MHLILDRPPNGAARARTRPPRAASAEENAHFLIARLGHELGVGKRFVEPDPGDLGAVQRDHVSPFLVGDAIGHRHTEAGGEHPVERRSEYHRAGCVRARWRGFPCRCAPRSGARAPRRYRRAGGDRTRRAPWSNTPRPCPGTCIPPRRRTWRTSAVADAEHPFADLLEALGVFRDQDGVGATGRTRMQRNPSCMPAHHLEDHAPFVGIAGRAQPVDRHGGNLQAVSNPKVYVGVAEVVVDRLGNTDDLDPVLEQAFRRRRRALTPDGDDCVHPEPVESGLNVLRTALRALIGADRLVPRIVPPCWARPRTLLRSNGIASPSTSPRQPSRKPTNSWP